MIQERILELVEYGLVTGLVEPEDKGYTINRLLELFGLDELEDEVLAAYETRETMTEETAVASLEEIAYRMGYINKEQLVELAQPLKKNDYGQYLLRLAQQD